jgi:hypothetical protein
MSELLPEARRNALLRRIDWRFLLHQVSTPQTLDWGAGKLSAAMRLAADVADGHPGAVDLVVLANPTGRRLAAAHDALRPGGTVYCEWRIPRPGGAQQARRLLRAAGFTDTRILWPWPPPALRAPAFWLPADAPGAIRQFIAMRPAASSLWQRGGRRALPAATACGLLAPVCALARRPQARAPRQHAADPISELVSGDCRAHPGRRGEEPAWALLTGGPRTISKVVGVPLDAAGARSEIVVKFARVPEADSGLHHEADVLAGLAARRSVIPGVPQVLATGRRCGRIAVAETAIHGVPLFSLLTRETYREWASRVTTLLIELAGAPDPQPRDSWNTRLVSRPFETFQRLFMDAVGASTLEAARRTLAVLGPLPLTCEHRDCAPWNLVLATGDQLAMLDWESAEPQGLPAMDLIYFLTNAAFMVEGALKSGRARETYGRLLDRTSFLGRVAADCLERYCTAVGIESGQLAALRVLCWIVHARSEHARATADSAGPPSARALQEGTFIGLLEEELRLNSP